MAKKTLSQATYADDNVQQLPVQVKGQASLVQQTFDKGTLDQKTYNNSTLLTELQSETPNDSGAHAIGFGSTQGDITSNNVGDALDEIVTIAKDAQGGTILPNSIGNDKLETDVKVGSLATLNTTEKSNVVGAINEVNANVDTNTTNITTLLGRGSIVNVTASRDLALSDANNYLRVTTGGTINITVPLNSSVAFDIGTEIAIIQATSGTASLLATGGVTINSLDSALSIDGQYAAVALKKVATDEWDLVGALA